MRQVGLHYELTADELQAMVDLIRDRERVYDSIYLYTGAFGECAETERADADQVAEAIESMIEGEWSDVEFSI